MEIITRLRRHVDSTAAIKTEVADQKSQKQNESESQPHEGRGDRFRRD